MATTTIKAWTPNQTKRVAGPPTPAASNPRQTIRKIPERTMRAVRSILPRFRLDDDRRPVRDNLRHGLPHFGRVEPHRQDRIGPHGRGILNHSVDRLSSRVLEERGEFVNLASSKRPHESGDVSTQSPASNNYPKYLTLGLDHSVFRDKICRRDDHWDTSLPS